MWFPRAVAFVALWARIDAIETADGVIDLSKFICPLYRDGAEMDTDAIRRCNHTMYEQMYSGCADPIDGGNWNCAYPERGGPLNAAQHNGQPLLMMAEKPESEGFHYFNITSGKCMHWAETDIIAEGCVPFATEGACTETCHEFMSTEEELEELLEEAEEEAIEILDFLYHFALMLYFCFGLALVCEDFFVSALDITARARPGRLCGLVVLHSNSSLY
jgi:hypothetical protein